MLFRSQIFLPNLNFYLLVLLYVFIVFCLCSLFIPSIRRKSKYFSIIFVPILCLTYFITDTSKYLKIFCMPKYNQEAILIVAPKTKPLYLSTRTDENDIRHIKNYLRLNNIPSDFTFYDLKKEDGKNKIKIAHGKISFEIIKNYKEKITNSANCVKLPILMKSDPSLKTVFSSYPENLIINDYKRLSKKSIKDIIWLKSQTTKTFFLSKSGTITLVTDGKKINLTTEF